MLKKKKNHILSLQSHNLFYIPIRRFPLSVSSSCYFPETNASRRYTKWLLQTAPASWLERSIYSALQWFLQKMHRVLKGDENYRGRSGISIFNPFRKCHDAP